MRMTPAALLALTLTLTITTAPDVAHAARTVTDAVTDAAAFDVERDATEEMGPDDEPVLSGLTTPESDPALAPLTPDTTPLDDPSLAPLTPDTTIAPDTTPLDDPAPAPLTPDTVPVDSPTEDGAAPVRVRASRSAVGGAAALARVRAIKRERQALDLARDELKRGRTAAIIRIENQTTDDELPARAAAIIEAELRRRGMFVKDHRAILPVIEKRGFTGFRSSRALRLLADHLGTNLLLFLTVERCLVSTFTEEYRDLAASGSLSLPGEEFVEIQFRLGAFDAARSEVLFSRRDRQFLVFGSGGDSGVRQASFDESLTTCLHNLLTGLP